MPSYGRKNNVISETSVLKKYELNIEYINVALLHLLLRLSSMDLVWPPHLTQDLSIYFDSLEAYHC